jgi:repressor LexA
LIDYKKANHIFPSYDEVCQSMGLNSKSHVRSLLEGLEQRGFIRRIPHKARAIEIIKYPDELAPHRKVAEPDSAAYIPPQNQTGANTDYITVPFYGAISSTIPIENFLKPENQITVPYSCISEAKKYNESEYMSLAIAGDTMKENAILNGDTVIIRTVDDAEPGSIVLAIVEEKDVLLRRWSIEGEKIILTAGNKYLMPQVYDKSQIKIRGKVVGLLRKF